MTVSSASRLVLRFMPRFLLVALPAVAFAIVSSSSPAAAQGGATAQSRIGFWQNTNGLTGTAGVGTLSNSGVPSGDITCVSNAGPISYYGVAYAAGADGMSGGDYASGSYSGSVWCMLTNNTSATIEMHGSFYVYTYGNAGDGGAASAFSNASMWEASTNGYAVTNGWDPYYVDYSTDDLFSTTAEFDLIGIEPGDFKAWDGSISGDAVAATN